MRISNFIKKITKNFKINGKKMEQLSQMKSENEIKGKKGIKLSFHDVIQEEEEM